MLDKHISRHKIENSVLYIRANFSQTSDQLWVNFESRSLTPEEWDFAWQLTPFTVVDAQHDRDKAAQLCYDWGG